MKNILRTMLVGILLGALAVVTQAQRTTIGSVKIREDRAIPTAKDFGIPILTPYPSSGYKKGILDCDINFVRCTVMNMPLLNQKDPRIDKDVQDMSPWGCYDTSIATVIITALANRKPSLNLGGRTKIFDSLVGDAKQPKEIKQVSYQYRSSKRHQAGEKENGKVVQPLYFHEVTADFNGGKILQKCDPFTYGDCDKLGNTGQATNLFSDAGRHWTANSAPVTNETIINLMESGYVVMLAYMRYKPYTKTNKMVYNAAKPITMIFDSYHKVVVSGFRKGEKYPLVINDVGNGQRFNVRIGSDIHKRKFQRDIDKEPFANAKLEFLSGEDPQTTVFVEYEGEGKGVNDMIFFLQHHDYLRINQ